MKAGFSSNLKPRALQIITPQYTTVSVVDPNQRVMNFEPSRQITPRFPLSRGLSASAWTAKYKIYAVRAGQSTGIFETWEEAKAQVSGFSGAEYKSFGDKNSAESWLRGEHYRGPSSNESTTHVYTDGSCLSSGTAGIGVHWEGVPEAKDLSERVPGRQTNNRAELYAVLRAIEKDPYPERELVVHLDSEYTLYSLTKYHNAKKGADWDDVPNQDLIRFVKRLIEKRPGTVKFEKVKAHSNNFNNELVDKLAKDGAALREAPQRGFSSP